MKRRLTFSLFAAVGLIAASPFAQAASKKADARAAALVSALQAVSPDPLGGRLGLAAANVGAPTVRTASGTRELTVQNFRGSPDERAYRIWKSSPKS